MINTKQKGFTSILLIFAIVIAGMMLFVLSRGSAAMAIESTDIGLEASARAMAASALAWANRQIDSGDIPDKSVELDVSALGGQKASCYVEFLKEDNRLAARITVSCRWGKRLVKKTVVEPL